MPPTTPARFTVTYALAGAPDHARRLAADLCIEQTVEFPADLIRDEFIRSTVFGRVEALDHRSDALTHATLSFAVDSTACELTQLLDVVFGNCSLLPGIRVIDLEPGPALLARLTGPRCGVAGLRDLLRVPDRPLLASALKPLGLSCAALAELAYQLALGGLDLIKDDHGLTDQPYAPFAPRVEACAAAVRRANQETGGRTLYAPNVTAPADQLEARVRHAQRCGAGALLIAPGLVGFDALRQLAARDDVGLPLLCHPALLGGLLHGQSGFSHGVLFGTLMRLAGGDAIIYPNAGGRFSFSPAECQEIARAAAQPLGPLRPSFPMPGGGMTFASIPELQALYGPDVIYLMGGGLFRHGPDLVESCRAFRRLVEAG